MSSEPWRWHIVGKPVGTPPTVGTTYEVAHTRKGKFTVRITSVAGEFASGVITKGRATALNPENERFVGDPVDMRDSLCVLTEVAS